ncbi:MAG: Glycosyltransferase [Parcubacteria group bacterium GW2011_GWA2_40_23]|nr:MAG: Glycosyltransferase [Parcubacteria group bacterium GW2011_GWA2_40_23]
MKIAVISNLYKPYTRGGAERIVELTVQGLKQAGHDVFVISTKPQKGIEVSVESDVRVYRFRPLNIFYYLDDYKYHFLTRFIWNIIDVFHFSSAQIISNILRDEKPDLVITHNLKGIGMLIPLAIKKLEIRHIHVLHDIQLVNPSGLMIWRQEKSFMQNGFLSKIYQFILRRIFSNVSKAVFPSEWLKNFYWEHRFFQKSEKEVLRNPVLPPPTVADIKKVKQNTFLYLGQLEEHKGVSWLLDCWIKNQIQSKLIIAGKGNLNLDRYKNAGNIELIGFIERNGIEDLFKRSDFLIFPSLCYENSPTVIIESLQNATPVIVADIGGSAELVQESLSGFVFKPKNEGELIAAIQKTTALSNLEYTGMSFNAQESVKGLDLAAYIEKLLE